MNENTNPSPAAQAAARLIVAALNTPDFDVLEHLYDLRDVMSDRAFAYICEKHDLCHIHLCDIEICADDNNPECAMFR